ncbi:PqqD family protein [Cyanobium sp. ATX 6A2]|uniref:PqqD family protein n=1 Tax=Cyanobium sp. ATX 6A2 TaxID=2823700 RepID=UPI0020CE874C|nr:PqqD family protein [Cyanobium sp. ATX 6A2]MCP9888687.1 PqqD family protein [Cyanobium sp. ATX 6A2]
MSTNPKTDAAPDQAAAPEPLTLAARLTVPAEVMDRSVGDETVILHLATGTYYGLDPVGARIWELIGAGQSLADIRDQMLQEYAVEAEQLEADLLKLVHDLLAQGLVGIDAEA